MPPRVTWCSAWSISELADANGTAWLAGSADVMLAGAPQQHLDPGEQVVDVERLGDEVVGAELEAEEGVAAALRAAAHEDRHVGHVLEDAAQHQPVLVGQHQIENDQVGLVLLNLRAGGGAGAGHYGPRNRSIRGRRST